MRISLALAYLALQLVIIVLGLFEPSTPFRWAPFDVQADYRISLEIGGQALSEQQITERYNEPAVGVEPHAIEHLLAVIEQYEMTYGGDDNASVLVRYRINGHEFQQWQWPRE